MTYVMSFYFVSLGMYHSWWRVPLAVASSTRLHPQSEKLKIPKVFDSIFDSILKKLTTTKSFLTSSMALCNFICARFSESSTVIKTWSSSFKCSQFGFPRFWSSCKVERKKDSKLTFKSYSGFIEREQQRKNVRPTRWLAPQSRSPNKTKDHDFYMCPDCYLFFRHFSRPKKQTNHFLRKNTSKFKTQENILPSLFVDLTNDLVLFFHALKSF